jgi:hypothetical protein
MKSRNPLSIFPSCGLGCAMAVEVKLVNGLALSNILHGGKRLG